MARQSTCSIRRNGISVLKIREGIHVPGCHDVDAEHAEVIDIRREDGTFVGNTTRRYLESIGRERLEVCRTSNARGRLSEQLRDDDEQSQRDAGQERQRRVLLLVFPRFREQVGR